MKIFVTYHKKTPLIQNEVLTPIHAGAALSDQVVDMIGDNTGDHISERNPYWCELTVLYWMWKNVDAEYYGLFHYRRLLGLKRRVPRYFFDASEQTLNKLGLNAEHIKEVCEGYDLVMPPQLGVRPPFEPDHLMSTYDFYAHDHIENDLKVTWQVIQEKYPEYALSTQLVMNQKQAYFCNMFIMRKPLFHKYASWLFDILFEVEKRITVKKDDAYQKRVFGFLAERLINVFVFHERCMNPALRMKEARRMPFGIFDDQFPYEQLLAEGTRWELALKCELPAQKRVEKPKVSVMVWGAQTGKYLAACLNSIIYQSLKEIEVIVLGVAPSEQDKLQAYAEKDKRLIFVEHATEGVEQACGQYLFFVNGWDYLERCALEGMFKKAQATNSSLVFCKTKRVDEQTEKDIVDDEQILLLTELLMQKTFAIKDMLAYFRATQRPFWRGFYARELVQKEKVAERPHTLFFDDVFCADAEHHTGKMAFYTSADYVCRAVALLDRADTGKGTSRDDTSQDLFGLMDLCEQAFRAGEDWEELKEHFLAYKVHVLWGYTRKCTLEEQQQFYTRLRQHFLAYDLGGYDLGKVNEEAFHIYVSVVSHASMPTEKVRSHSWLKQLGKSAERSIKKAVRSFR